MKILATVDTVAINIIGEIGVTKSRYLQHFQRTLGFPRAMVTPPTL